MIKSRILEHILMINWADFDEAETRRLWFAENHDSGLTRVVETNSPSWLGRTLAMGGSKSRYILNSLCHKQILKASAKGVPYHSQTL
jgi:hypothetical protein